ncbi:MAG: hypothetical protein KatS3mg036_0678 [Ignavibacterium sp.]|nr:MAG: hypothetical protein KatS3mg036_0678 [Ignavibacterium sp.]
MKIIMTISLVIVFVLTFIKCGDNKTKAGDETSMPISSIPDKKMCELFTKENMSSITGINFDEVMSTIHQVDKSNGIYVSQCAYYVGKASLGVLVRIFANSTFSKTKEGLLGVDYSENPDTDEILQTALKTCKIVTDLGDAAIFCDLGGSNNLIVVFDDHYQIQISSYGEGFGFDDKTMEISKKVAEKVISVFRK